MTSTRPACAGDLEKRKKDEAENDFRANILKQAVNNLQAEIPECMILEKVEADHP